MHVIHGSSRTTADNSHTWAQPPTATIAMAQPSTDTPAFRLERGASYELTTCRCSVPFQSGQRVATCQGDEFAIEMCGNLVTIIPVQIGPEGLGTHFVATEWRPQGALLTSWQNPTFTEEDFCYKMAVQADP